MAEPLWKFIEFIWWMMTYVTGVLCALQLIIARFVIALQIWRIAVYNQEFAELQED